MIATEPYSSSSSSSAAAAAAAVTVVDPRGGEARDDELVPVPNENDDGAEVYELRHLDRGLTIQNNDNHYHEHQHRPEELDKEEEDEEASDDDDDDESYNNNNNNNNPSGLTPTSFLPDEELAVVRKLDRNLVLFLAVCYLFSFLDRSNISNARVAGMEEDLQSSPPKDGYYEFALMGFYVSYIAFEWFSLLWKVIRAHVFVSIIVLSWGLTASLQSVAPSYPVLIFLRVLLGAGEAAFTGVPFYLSFFFKRHELAFRTALFISAAPLATCFASTLAWLILKLAKTSPIAPWRLLFLLEGFPSILLATAAWHRIPDSPQEASFLTDREKKVARLRLRLQPNNKKNKKNSPTGLDLNDVASVLKDPAAWTAALMLLGANVAYSSLPVFLPTILTEMGHSALESQALAAPPYFMAFLGVLGVAHLSDRVRSRWPFVVVSALVSAVGYLVMALARPLSIPPMLRYLAVYPAVIGFFNVVVLIIAWDINNQPSESRQGGGFVLMQLIGQCGPLVGTRLYPKKDSPFFEKGMWTCAAAMTCVAILAGVLRAILIRRNRRSDLEGPTIQDGEETQGLFGVPKSAGTGEAFRYML